MGAEIRGTFVQIFGDFGAFLGHILLDQGYVEGFAAVMLLVLRPCWSTWMLFLCGLTWAGGLLRSACKAQKNMKNAVRQV